MTKPTVEQLHAINQLKLRLSNFAPALAGEINILLDALPPEFTDPKYQLPSGPENYGKAFVDEGDRVWSLSSTGMWYFDGCRYSSEIVASYLPLTPLVPKREPVTTKALQAAYGGAANNALGWQAVADLANGETK